MSKTRFIETQSGLMIEIIDPDPEVLEAIIRVEPTTAEMISAAAHYMIKRYGPGDWEETLSVLNNRETMSAISEAQAEDDTPTSS